MKKLAFFADWTLPLTGNETGQFRRFPLRDSPASSSPSGTATPALSVRDGGAQNMSQSKKRAVTAARAKVITVVINFTPPRP